jgi:hypothetical protein
VHLAAAVLLHGSHRSRGAGQNRHHHDKHDEDCYEARKAPHEFQYIPLSFWEQSIRSSGFRVTRGRLISEALWMR